ncbi:MAG: dTDP-4-dehydrorhamnose reductase, partial [Betaproteobacteria bacterium]|nr:dTDP-4-dehydrorhamnose reductase [Betaproteobacteria bacterium]
MKILLTGPTGQVGGELGRVFQGLGEVVSLPRSALDLAQAAMVARVIRDLRPDLILNAAAYTAVDRAESERELAMAVNGQAPKVMAEEAKKLGAFLVHYSTDYIFDGSKAGPYAEDDIPHPINAYGESKLEGERAIVASGCGHLILRTSWVYAPRGKNFFLTIAQKARSGAPLRVVADQRGVPTSASYTAETTRALL